MKRRDALVPGQLAIIGFLAASNALADVEFRGLGVVPGGSSSTPRGTSANGAVVVGQSWVSDHYEAYRWSAETGMVSLGDLPGGSVDSTAWAVSADGSIVVGRGATESDRAFRWTASAGMVALPDLPGGDTLSRAEGITPDGNVIVGSCSGPTSLVPTRWTSAGVEALGTGRGDAHDVSADGSVVAGSRATGAGWFEAFRWTAATGIVGLGALPGADRVESYGEDMSDDGSVIVGGCSYDNLLGDLQAYRWTIGGGMVGLGFVGGDIRSFAQAVSGDGRMVVGYSYGRLGGEPFVWTEARGMRSLQVMLQADYGLNLAGWALGLPWAISADGTAIVGEGFNPNGQSETWLVSGLPLPCVADLNNDRAVDLADLAVLLSSFGCVSGPCVDLTGDGETGLDDLALLLQGFGTDCR
jgi:probable HAF family extracellular repeat protein